MNDIFSYEEAVEYIHSLGESVIKLGLERFRALCESLGNPQNKLRIIHIAGTNGKGSTAAMVSAILRANNYKVGAYYSPFVYDIRERFMLNGEMIPPVDFVRLVNTIRPHALALEKTPHGHPTEFEMKTAIALLYFAEQEVDFAVLEVGLGGRLDATNIVTPLVSVITNVGLDHMERLGNTISEIAFEKAGIIKEGIPVVTAAQDSEALKVIRQVCDERHTNLFHVQPTNYARCFKVEPQKDSSLRGPLCESSVQNSFSLDGILTRYENVEVGMKGEFQLVNAATALATIEVLIEHGFCVSEQAIREGLKKAYAPGRLEVLHEKPFVVVDGAHNLNAARELAQSLCRIPHNRLILVIGMVSGHSVEDVMSELAPLAHTIIATKSSNIRAAPAETIANIARQFCSNVEQITPIREAVRRALALSSSNDLVCVTGSFYTVGEAPRDIKSLVNKF
ncbi:MAG: bifunctional folylpolyglutamate synthase/dihydrofolate synthase [Armatimonadetes bacterium]|nr:bifunctional folylpolyglutamate synthase/dihydrofolate synthase [Armatimonadota bacterium]